MRKWVDIEIFTDSDEWYYVEIKILQKQLSNFDAKDIQGVRDMGHAMFRCDQFDGLINCIENEILTLK